VAQFRQQFISSAARYLDYPHAALANEAEGEVVVSVSFAAGRAAAEVSVKTSSGHYLLDAQALDMFRRAAAELALPGALRGQEFAFEVPVVYALKR
jgi:TonB family protein